MKIKMEKLQIPTMNRYAFILLFLALITMSCVKEELSYSDSLNGNDMVDVSLKLSIASEDGDTKAISDVGFTPSTKIRNVNILQFAGTDDSAVLLGEVIYLSDTAAENKDDTYLNLEENNKIQKIKLAESQGQMHTIVILANTFEKLRQVSNLGELRKLYRTLDKDYKVFGYEGDGKNLPDSMYYQRMNSIAVTKIDNGTVLRAKLRRSMARINLHITNDGKDGLAIQSVQLREVSGKEYYLTDYRYFDPITQNDKRLYPDDFQDEYDPDDPHRNHYDPVEWKGSDNGTGSSDYTFYVPANQRGVYENNLYPYEKNRCPNVNGATHVRIYATYGTAGNKTNVIYTFYLGANLINDFNIRPNTSYTYNLSFSGKGNSVVDSRIDDLATVHFAVDANCYMLLTPKDYSRSFTFNAVQRPNFFWGGRFGLEATYPNNIIDSDDEWKARILWSDFEMTQEQASAFLVKRIGDSNGGYMDMNQRIMVTVPTGMKGNVIVGMYLDEPEHILWSWHLWITDYNPDEIKGHAPYPERFVYPVTGGAVHRYNGVSWNDPAGRYKNGYAMDRALGAIDEVTQENNYAGGLRYQWGRKDPFREGIPVWTYYVDDTPTKQSPPAYNKPDEFHELSTSVSDSLSAAAGPHMPYAVTHPTKKLPVQLSWDISDLTQEWNDHMSTYREPCEEQGGYVNKSFFDPCPPGWRVPSGVAKASHLNTRNLPLTLCCFADFKGGGSDTTDPKVTTLKDVDPYHRGSAHTYFPNGYLAYLDDKAKGVIEPQAIYFPYITGGENYYWTTIKAGTITSFALRISPWHALDVYGNYNTRLGGVRCVREDY